MATAVPMSHPATAVKNSDGTYTVRIQHTVEGSITEVDFKNVLFAEVLATAYAAMLNGQAVVEAKVDQIASDAAPALADAKADVKKLLTEAEAEAQKLIVAAKQEASEIKGEAGTFFAEVKANAEKMLADAKTEAVTLLNEARTEASKLMKEAAAKIEPTPASTTESKSAVHEEDEA